MELWNRIFGRRRKNRAEGAPAQTASAIERSLHSASLASILDTVEAKLPDRSADGSFLETPDNRIRTPFESAIEMGSITLKDLKRWGALPMECTAASIKEDRKAPDDTTVISTKKGRTIISTGRDDRTNYDWPQEAQAAREKYGTEEKLSEEDRLMLIGMQEAFYATRHIYDSPLAYKIHNHPGQDPRPSSLDINWSAETDSDIDIILTESEIVFYRYDPQTPFADQNPEKSDRAHFANLKSIKAVFPLSESNPRMATVLDFLNRKISWEQAAPIITASR